MMKAAEVVMPTTTKKYELFGWCGSMTWLFLMIYSYDIFIRNVMAYFEGGSWVQFCFMLLSALSIAVFGYCFGRDPKGLGNIAYFTTPVAIVITAILGILPESICPILYIFSSVLMAPVITRRVYGVIRTSESGNRIISYATGFTVAFIIFAVWVALDLPKNIAFLVPALLSVPSWIGIGRSLTLPLESPKISAVTLSKQNIVVLSLAITVVFWLIVMGRMILTNVFSGGDESSEPAAMDILLAWIPPAICFLIFSFIRDKGYERAGFICFISLSLFGTVFALLPGISHGALTLMLILTFCFGEIYVEYFTYSVHLNYLASAKRPVLVAPVGSIFFLIISAMEWKKDVWLPKIFMEIGTPLLVSTAISTVLFIVLVYFLFEKHKENTLTAALYQLLHNDVNTKKSMADANKKITSAAESIQINKMGEVLTQEEIEVALLLVEGKMRSEITRSLHLTADEADSRINAIRNKINHMRDSDPVIAKAISAYKLTHREVDVLRCLLRKMSNAEIAVELFLSEETVKTHVRNLLRKLKIYTRKEIESWAAALLKNND